MIWEKIDKNKVIKTLEYRDLMKSSFQIPEEFHGFFQGENERVGLIYSNREYPSYIEQEGETYQLKLSKVLMAKLIEKFPDYKTSLNEENMVMKKPKIEFQKVEKNFEMRLIINEDGLSFPEKSAKKESGNLIKPELRSLFSQWITGYQNYYPRDFRFSFKDIINEDIPKVLDELVKNQEESYLIKGFAGDMQWAEIPWVGVFDKRITETIDQELSLLYLLSMDSRKLYLALVYADEALGAVGLSDKVYSIRKKLELGCYQTNHQEVSLGNQTLVSGILCFVEYSEELPDNEMLIQDFMGMKKIYTTYVEQKKVMDETHLQAEKIEALDDKKENYIMSEIKVDLMEDNKIVIEDEILKIERNGLEKSENKKLPFQTISKDPIKEIKIEEKEAKTEEKEIEQKEKIGSEEFENENNENNEISDQVSKELYNEKIKEKEALQDPIKEETHKKKKYAMKNEKLPEYLQGVMSKMTHKGYYYPPELVKTYYLSLKAKPFVIIKGDVGSGKTSFPRLFAEAIGANSKNGRYQRASIRKETDNEKKLFGFVDNRGHFIPGPVMTILKSCKEYPEMPHFLVLDEMDKVKVNDYFWKLLEGINGSEEPFLNREDFGSDLGAFREYGDDVFPENLFIIGIINQEEESYPLYSKVRDSGNTIKMPGVTISAFPEYPLTLEAKDWEINQFKLQSKVQGLTKIIETIMIKLKAIQEVLLKFNLSLSYRRVNEILAYGINSGVEGLFNEREVIDFGLTQRILPMIDCVSKDKRAILEALAFVCMDEKSQLMDIQQQLEAFLKEEVLIYPRCGKQILIRLKQSESDE